MAYEPEDVFPAQEEIHESSENTVFCPKCGYRYRADFKSCPQCGTKNRNRYSSGKNNGFWKILIVILVLVSAFATGILFLDGRNVKYIGDRSVQYDEDYDELQILFSFQNKRNKRIASDATFDIRIVSGDNQTVYRGTVNITTDDFGNWTNSMQGERYLGCIRIPASKIIKGSTKSGKVYFTAYKDNEFYFDESVVECNDLPVNLPELRVFSLPITLNEYSYFKNSSVTITDVTYETSDYSSWLRISLYGKKTSGGTGYVMFSYKIKDNGNNVIDSGIGMTDSISVGDSFIETFYCYKTEYGQIYTLELGDYRY